MTERVDDARQFWPGRVPPRKTSLSLIVRLKDGELLIAGDAIYFVDTLDHERRGQFLDDEHNWRRSLREIQLFRRENPDTLIIPSHDHELWARLDETYE